MSRLFPVLCTVLGLLAIAEAIYSAYYIPEQNNDLESVMSDVAKQLTGQSGKSARAMFISNSISKITNEFFPLLTNHYDPSHPSNGPYYVVVYNTEIGIDIYGNMQLLGGWQDVSDETILCTDLYRNAEHKCIHREKSETASVEFDGTTFTAVVFSQGWFNKCGKAGGSHNWGFTYDGPFPPSATDTNCTSDPYSTTAIPCTATNRCYIQWPCKKYCTCDGGASACS